LNDDVVGGIVEPIRQYRNLMDDQHISVIRQINVMAQKMIFY